MSYDREKVLNEIYELAYRNEAEYGVCSQAVLAALWKYFGFIEEGIIKASHVLAGGIARCTDGSCGALNGGLLAISCFYGREYREFGEKTPDHEKAELLSQDLHDRFTSEFGGVICREVQEKMMGRSYNLRDPEEFEKFEAAGAHEEKCPSVTGKVAFWTAEIFLDHGIQPQKR